jgi:hypothetical protein
VHQVQLRLEVVHRQSRDGLITEDVAQGAVAQRFVIVVGN